MDWNKLKAFYEVATCSSISKASNKLNISQSAISRQIQDLELNLKTALFIRHQKGVILTEQGENLFNSVKKIHVSISEFEQKLQDKKKHPFGKLIINTTIGFGATWLTPRINKFIDQFPVAAYLQKRGIPRSVNDLDKHDLICQFGAGSASPVSNIDWILTVGKNNGKRKPKFKVNSTLWYVFSR